MSVRHPPFTSAQQFAYALAGQFNLSFGLPEDRLAEDAPEQMARIATSLSRDWGASGGEDIRRILAQLGTDGHRTSHRLMVRHYALACRPEIAARREEMLDRAREDADALEDLWRMEAVQSDRHAVRSAPLLGFDASRAAMLATCSMALGWSEPETLWPFLFALAADVQRSFDGWAAYAADYRCGFAFWNGKNQRSFHDRSVDALLSPEGLWSRLPWGVPDLVLPLPERDPVPGEPVWVLES